MIVNLKSPAMRRDPYPGYATMRQSSEPVMIRYDVDGTNVYFLTRYTDVMTALKDPRFANDRNRLPGKGGIDLNAMWYIPKALKVLAYTMALHDDPDHARLKKLVHKAFTPTRIAEMAADIERLANEYLDQAAKQPVVDLMDAFAIPLPLTVIGNMMGISAQDRHKFRRWMGNNITDASPDEPLKAIYKLVNTMGLGGFLERLIDDRRRHPKPDLTTALVQAEDDGDQLSENELIGMLFLLLFAGHETTVNLIGSGTLALLQHPDQLEKLKADPTLLDSTIEELLRYTNPVQHVAPRYALEDVEIGGVKIAQGSTVMLGIAAANYDPDMFPNPDQLDITRNPNRHVALGFGVHYCVGAPLARLEGKIAFEVLLRRYPHMQLAAAPETLKWHGVPALRGLDKLPIQLNG
ncbi:MAG: cytochrome P450 family protein [Phototrophicaceae bacterium]|jgi:cytochrome P450 PksS